MCRTFSVTGCQLAVVLWDHSLQASDGLHHTQVSALVSPHLQQHSWVTSVGEPPYQLWGGGEARGQHAQKTEGGSVPPLAYSGAVMYRARVAICIVLGMPREWS